MNINKITASFAIITAAIAISSCAEDKYYDMGGGKSELVRFKAINLALPDSLQAESTDLEYYYLKEIDRKFPVFLHFPNDVYDGEMIAGNMEMSLKKESTVWSGGYNPIQMTFTPSAPEEKSATFTMPDGSTYTATAENPTFIWTPDSTLRDMGYLYVDNTFIKGESHFVKGNTTYDNIGFIYLDIQRDYRFNPDTDKWYYSQWIYGQPLTSVSYNKFTASTHAVNRTSPCTSSNIRFPETVTERTDTLFFPVKISDEDYVNYEEKLKGNQLWACRDAFINFTFLPQNGEKEMILYLPDGSKALLTSEKPYYEWYVGNHYYDGSRIYGTSTYTKDGIVYNAESEVYVYFDYHFWFNTNYNAFIQQ